MAAVLKALNSHFNVELFFVATGLTVKERGAIYVSKDRSKHH